MSKRRGFTLTEIVVVIALTSLVLAMVGGCLYFVSTYSGTLISKSEELTKVQTIETHLRSVIGNTDSKISIAKDGTPANKYTIGTSNPTEIIWNEDQNTLKIGNSVEYKDVTDFTFYTKSGEENRNFLYCKIAYNNGESYTFILGITINDLQQ